MEVTIHVWAKQVGGPRKAFWTSRARTRRGWRSCARTSRGWITKRLCGIGMSRREKRSSPRKPRPRKRDGLTGTLGCSSLRSMTGLALANSVQCGKLLAILARARSLDLAPHHLTHSHSISAAYSLHLLVVCARGRPSAPRLVECTRDAKDMEEEDDTLAGLRLVIASHCAAAPVPVRIRLTGQAGTSQPARQSNSSAVNARNNAERSEVLEPSRTHTTGRSQTRDCECTRNDFDSYHSIWSECSICCLESNHS